MSGIMSYEYRPMVFYRATEVVDTAYQPPVEVSQVKTIYSIMSHHLIRTRYELPLITAIVTKLMYAGSVISQWQVPTNIYLPRRLKTIETVIESIYTQVDIGGSVQPQPQPAPRSGVAVPV